MALGSTFLVSIFFDGMRATVSLFLAWSFLKLSTVRLSFNRLSGNLPALSLFACSESVEIVSTRPSSLVLGSHLQAKNPIDAINIITIDLTWYINQKQNQPRFLRRCIFAPQNLSLWTIVLKKTQWARCMYP